MFSGVAQVFFIGILATGFLEGLRPQRWRNAEFAALDGFAATAHLAASGWSDIPAERTSSAPQQTKVRSTMIGPRS